MSVLDIFKKRDSRRAGDDASDGIPVLGRDEEQEAPITSRLSAEALEAEEARHEGELNQELPSVNRRRSNSSLAGNLGYVVIALGGLMMMYLVLGEDRSPEKVKKAPQPTTLTNNLPPIAAVAPPEPEPLQVTPPPSGTVVPAIDPNTQPIPVKEAPRTERSPEGPGWEDRKMGGQMVIQGREGGKPTLMNVHDEGRQADESDDYLGALGQKLRPTVTKPVKAQLLPDRNYLIAKGTSLDCALETAIDSTAPGITTCRLTSDVYSDNGHVVLLDRGSQLVGEYQGGVSAGQVRIFVVWTRAKTPNGVVVALNSPGTDPLGRSGHEGWVDTHFMERFGAAIMVSFIKDVIAYARAEQSKNGAVVIQGGDSNTDRMATEILKNTVNIPPTLYVNHGEHIRITVARDLDFSTVYGLKLKED